MASYLTATLDFSPDPLSDTTPTYTNVTSYLLEAKWWGGKTRDRDESQPGGAEFLLKNTNRDWEPDYLAGRWAGNIDIGRRFRWRITTDGTTFDEGIFCAASYELSYPAGTRYSVVKITCVDEGFALLALDNLPTLDPPDATSYAEVVQFDEPFAYYRLGEPEGTKLVSHLRRAKRGATARSLHRTGIQPFRRYRTRETAAEVTGLAGSAGVYANTPALGAPGLILGDQDTAVLFRSAQSEYARVPVEVENFRGALSVEAWVKLTTGGEQEFVCGPQYDGSSEQIFNLGMSDFGSIVFWFDVLLADGTLAFAIAPSVPSTATIYHLVGTWDGQWCRLYIDSELVTEEFYGGGSAVRVPTAGRDMLIGRSQAGFYADSVIDEVAVYERALSPERIAAHFTAGTARGFPEQKAWERFRDIVDPVIAESIVTTGGGFDVQPVMQYGQSRLDEIREAVAAEQPHSQFFFDGLSQPTYLGWDYKSTGSYGTSQATIGDIEGEVRYQSIELEFDNEVFTEWTLSAEGGTAQTVSDQPSIDARGRRAGPPETGLINAEDSDVLQVAGALLEEFKAPALRPVKVLLNASKPTTRAQIMNRHIGDMVRVRRRGEGGTPIDRMTHILGYTKTLDTARNLTCEWNLARGFNASQQTWRLGITGFTELNSTAVLG